MFGKGSPPAETLPEDRVKLKPLLGIRPGVYLVWLYGFIILGILFFILVYPGLARPGSLIAFSSEPRGAAVRLDGVYLGTAPGEFFIPRGRRRFEMSLPGFEPWEAEQEIGGRLFASNFFPRREAVRGTLALARPEAAFSRAASDYAEWSLAGEPTAAYQIPLSLSEGAYRAGPAGRDPGVYQNFTEILQSAPGFALTQAALRDLIRAKCLIDNGGLSPSPVSLLRSAGDILNFLSESPGAALWLGELLPPETAAPVIASSWYKRDREAPVPEAPPPGAGPGGRIVLAESLGFRELPGGVLIQNTPFPRRIEIGPFSIAENEVSLGSWEAFVRANPEWGKENIAALLEAGLVNEDYLEGPGNPELQSAYPPGAAPGISWHAARAYCQWQTSLLPSPLAAYEVRLPTEAEWEYAAKNQPEGGLADMLGGMWEWCGDPFIPLPLFAPSQGGTPPGELPFNSPEKPVRGGSWINPAGSVDGETRASLPPASCSPFVSFRPVLAPRGKP
ncbi:MAG: SUMF1/EgtB/PvdO family nonheme iron enzyme [Treponema sp.]|jgi:hypothetical protein|nr:SUMF1/EgtB/PvdO family nonheme iron enzyme [Treponema sp.]